MKSTAAPVFRSWQRHHFLLHPRRPRLPPHRLTTDDLRPGLHKTPPGVGSYLVDVDEVEDLNFEADFQEFLHEFDDEEHNFQPSSFTKASSLIPERTSKGQSQKMQQEVLRKFRSSGYNVLVATSIAEEGLDIMEVDLVICFDANISPLRMIQRMGRTGRKHDGLILVLACEGTELKGYHRKQANSKAVRKHMHNGGAHSFEFQSSPRMVA